MTGRAIVTSALGTCVSFADLATSTWSQLKNQSFLSFLQTVLSIQTNDRGCALLRLQRAFGADTFVKGRHVQRMCRAISSAHKKSKKGAPTPAMLVDFYRWARTVDPFTCRHCATKRMGSRGFVCIGGRGVSVSYPRYTSSGMPDQGPQMPPMSRCTRSKNAHFRFFPNLHQITFNKSNDVGLYIACSKSLHYVRVSPLKANCFMFGAPCTTETFASSRASVDDSEDLKR